MGVITTPAGTITGIDRKMWEETRAGIDRVTRESGTFWAVSEEGTEILLAPGIPVVYQP